jgi:hypothetical protein
MLIYRDKVYGKPWLKIIELRLWAKCSSTYVKILCKVKKLGKDRSKGQYQLFDVYRYIVTCPYMALRMILQPALGKIS